MTLASVEPQPWKLPALGEPLTWSTSSGQTRSRAFAWPGNITGHRTLWPDSRFQRVNTGRPHHVPFVYAHDKAQCNMFFSTMTTWGKNREEEAAAHILKSFAGGPVSIVSDSYDLWNFIGKIVGEHLKYVKCNFVSARPMVTFSLAIQIRGRIPRCRGIPGDPSRLRRSD